MTERQRQTDRQTNRHTHTHTHTHTHAQKEEEPFCKLPMFSYQSIPRQTPGVMEVLLHQVGKVSAVYQTGW